MHTSPSLKPGSPVTVNSWIGSWDSFKPGDRVEHRYRTGRASKRGTVLGAAFQYSAPRPLFRWFVQVVWDDFTVEKYVQVEDLVKVQQAVRSQDEHPE